MNKKTEIPMHGENYDVKQLNLLVFSFTLQAILCVMDYLYNDFKDVEIEDKISGSVVCDVLLFAHRVK